MPTLNWYIDNFIRGEGLDVEFEEAGFDEDLPAPVSLALYRVAQEALTNVVRHAGASRVSISLTKGYPYAIMEIEDNGRGISTQKAKTKTQRARAREHAGEDRAYGRHLPYHILAGKRHEGAGEDSDRGGQ